MILSCIWWWCSSLGTLEVMEYPFIVINPRSTFTRSSSTCWGPIYGSNKTVKPFNFVKWCKIELLVLHSNTWNHLTACQKPPQTKELWLVLNVIKNNSFTNLIYRIWRHIRRSPISAGQIKKNKVLIFIFFYHTTCESRCDTLSSSAANQGDNTVSVAQGGTATPSATKQLW